MNTTTIEKCLQLLDRLDIEALRELLNVERVKAIFAEKGTSPTLAKAVTNYIKAAQPSCAGIGDNNGNPFLCDGYSLIAWKKSQPTLSALPKMEKELNAEALFNQRMRNLRRVEVTDEERETVFELEKYVKLYSQRNCHCAVYLFGAFWDAKYLLPIVKITGFDFTEIILKYAENGMVISAIAENDDVKILLLPLRLTQADEQAKIQKRTQDFCRDLIEKARG